MICAWELTLAVIVLETPRKISSFSTENFASIWGKHYLGNDYHVSGNEHEFQAMLQGQTEM